MGFWILSFGFSAQAWQITKELEQELSAKRAALEQNPNDPLARFDLAITDAYTNNILDGWNELKKLNETNPDFKNKCYKIYEKKVTANPSDWRLRFRLAFAYYFIGRKEEAVHELKNVLVLDPYNVWAYGYISLIYGEMGEVDKAIDAARAGLKIDDMVAALHLLLAEGYYKKNDPWSGFWERSTALRLKMQGF